MSTVSQADYARMKGVTRQYVSKLVRQGKIPTVAGRIDPAEADAALAAQADPARRLDEPDAPAAGPGGAELAGDVSFKTARTARETFLAKSAEIDLHERLGNLVDRGELEDAMMEIGTSVRAALDRRAGELAEQLAAVDDPRQARGIIQASDRKLLEDLAAALRKLAAGEEGDHAQAA